MAAGDPPIIPPSAFTPVAFSPSPTREQTDRALGGYYLAPLPTIPRDGVEGDLLVMRNGEPAWVSPREALGLPEQAPMSPFARVPFGQGFVIEGQRAGGPVPVRAIGAELPIDHIPARRSAWEHILDDEDD